ncbi:nicotinate-nucleotide--dimethylbenzimidazole phosphoribosyltransferase [Streptomyces sp. TRM76323]|uniref:Nicotinate-nucleotide--dimethylbenzimidazole phosphoribosyltransferase n=1 Tax=Streptomyces tamarix TaxID=3078565 RepID=A0ABU3QNV4_9ACTN|nr:nicotinate-nucleotide--dimethylbenzimidazole phosphoribosyltransferase [Streptomyces tamarix]MDT9684178.1 nicotinate-nucleotide--dimethylbenzimidazole phosphoribosyltransferase [Streptomyces tamarix]
MTDTGQVPGEGQPEHAGMVEQPGMPVPDAYTFLDPSAADDDDLLLMPGAQGAWTEPQPGVAPAPPVTVPMPQTPPAEHTAYDPPAAPEAAAPAYEHPYQEAGAQGSGTDGHGVVHAPHPAQAPAPAQAPQQAPRRPLHMGPPMPDTGGVVRSLADRGPAPVPPAPAPVQSPPAPGPEHLDAPGPAARDAQPWAQRPAAAETVAPEAPGGFVPGEGAAPYPDPAQHPVPSPRHAATPQQPHEPHAPTWTTPAHGVPAAAQPLPIPAQIQAEQATGAPEPVQDPAGDPGVPAPSPEQAAVPEHGAPAQEVAVPAAVPAEQPADPLAPEAAPAPEPVPAATPPAPAEAAVAPAPPVEEPPMEAPAEDPVAPAGAVTPEQVAVDSASAPVTVDPAAPVPADPAVQPPAELVAVVAAPVEEPPATPAAAPVEEPPAAPVTAEAVTAGIADVETAPAPAEAVPAAPVADVVPAEEAPEAAVPSAEAPVADAPAQDPVAAGTSEGVPAAPVAVVAPSAGEAPAEPVAEAVPAAPAPAPEAAPTAGDTLEEAPAETVPTETASAETAPADAPTAPVSAAEEAPAEAAPAEPAPTDAAPTQAPTDAAPAQAPAAEGTSVDAPTAEAAPTPVAPSTGAAAPAAPADGAAREDRADDAEAPEAADAAPAGPPAPGYADDEREAILRVMRERRDIRNGFRSDPIPHEVLLRVLEAAHTAPSVGHSQPWDFVVIRSAETRRTMHELAQRQREAYAKSLPKGRAKQFKELKIEAILDTPVNIVVTADPTRGGRHTLGRHTQPQMAPYSSALAVENLWLAARAEGLGVGWVSFFDEREMVRALGLPEHLEVVAYLCVGYVDEFPEEPELMQAGWSKRRPLSWVVHEETYGRRALPGEEPHDLLQETVANIRPLDAKALGEAWERQKRMTKPAGALGMLEIISAQLCGLSRTCPPPIPEPAAVAIFAGDHGVHAQGVTAWPQEVTAQMVANFLGGGAVCNAFAHQVGAEVCVVDVGVAADLPATPGLLPRKVRAGTADFTTGPALTRDEVLAAIEVGIETARDLVAAGNKAILTGEMGIANTTASAALISVYTDADPAEVTGRGTGINDEMHARKVDVVRRALDLHQPDPADPIGVLGAVGGLEHAAMVGFILGGASLRTPVVLDGVSAGAAALVARAVAPESLAACIAGHRSAEPGHMAALGKLGLRPLVDLDLRLGEGTGALLALPLVQSAARAMHEVATFDSAGVTEK